MVSDDLSYSVLKKECDRIHRLYDEEKKKTAELERKLEEQDKRISGQYEKLFEDEKRFISGEETLHTLEQEKIKALSQHLAREHKLRLELTEEKEKLAKDYEKKLAEEGALRERLLAEKDAEIEALKGELVKKDNAIDSLKGKAEEYKARELDNILNVEGEPSDSDLIKDEDSNWITETQDLVKILHRWGSIKLSEAAQTMESDKDTVRSYAKVLVEKGLIKVDDLDSENPTLRATRNLVGKLNELKVRMRRRGRLQ
jgi:hypothetical protein